MAGFAFWGLVEVSLPADLLRQSTIAFIAFRNYDGAQEHTTMARQAVSTPEAETSQIEELHRLFQLGAPCLVGPDGKERLQLPPTVFVLLKDIVSDMQRGKTILLVRDDEELTTQTAANLIGVSRPHLIKLLESQKIPFHKTGSHRRICLKDALAYAEERDAKRKELLNRMTKEAFDNGDYDDVRIPAGSQDE